MEEHKPKYRGKSKPDGTFTLTFENDYQKQSMTLGSERFLQWVIHWLRLVSPEMRRKALERMQREVTDDPIPLDPRLLGGH